MEKLKQEIKTKKNFLCIGLDSDIDKLPTTFKRYKNPVFEFNKAVVEATQHLCVSYKLNTAFYESRGPQGWEDLERTVQIIPPNIFTIADAKRGDIGNTAAQYAKAFFEQMSFDSITVNPYMGLDTLDPYLAYDDKVVIVLALTSNKGSEHFEMLQSDNKSVYEHVLAKVSKHAATDRVHFVVGATHPEALTGIRKVVPNNFLLVPGVGAQGGDLKAVYTNGHNQDTGLLVNVSRGIIFAGNDSKDPIKGIVQAAESYAAEMKALMSDGQ